MFNCPHPPEHEEQLAERRLKLDYNSLVSSSESTLHTWEGILDFIAPCLKSIIFYAGFLTASDPVPDRASVREAVGLGIPRSKRGEAWQLMAKMSKAKPPSAEKFPSLTMVALTSISHLNHPFSAVLEPEIAADLPPACNSDRPRTNFSLPPLLQWSPWPWPAWPLQHAESIQVVKLDSVTVSLLYWVL